MIVKLNGITNGELHVAEGAYTALHIDGQRVRVLTPFEEEFVRSCLAVNGEYAEEIIRVIDEETATWKKLNGQALERMAPNEGFETAIHALSQLTRRIAALAKNPATAIPGTQPAECARYMPGTSREPDGGTPDVELTEDRLKAHLRAHYLRAIECRHESGTDIPHCACCEWPCPAQPNVGQAVERWVEHFMATLPVAPRVENSFDESAGMDSLLRTSEKLNKEDGTPEGER